jgi:folate-dependent phosphoribosylglycinamide formyltransferase PurN
MRVIVLAPSVYSERALATIAALVDAGHAPVGCLCIRTASWGNVWRKMAELGPRRFAGFAARKLGWSKGHSQATSEPFDAGGLENVYIARRLAGYGCRARDVSELCAQAGIAMRRCGDLHQRKSLAFLRELKPDVLVYTGGGILRRALLEIPTIGVLNTHAGVLPHYRGMNVTEWALLAGAVPGTTLQLIDAGIDTGPILSIKPVELTERDTTIERLRQRVADLTVDQLVEGVVALADGTAQRQPQKPGEGKQYFVMHEKLLALAERRLRQRVRRLEPCSSAT